MRCDDEAVRVEVHLDQSGNVSDARVLSGREELRKPVLQSVLGWHFTPDADGSTDVEGNGDVDVTIAAPGSSAPPGPPQ